MKCRICGAKLRKEGDICKACYEEYCKEEALEKDVKEVYKIHRKYLPIYQVIKYFDWIFVALLFQQQIFHAIVFLIISLICLGIALFLAKRRAVNTTCTFYTKKVVLKYKDRKKTLPYADLKEITYYQSFFQKVFKLADVQFRPEEGSYLINGFEVKNVPDFDNTWKKIEEIISSKKGK